MVYFCQSPDHVFGRIVGGVLELWEEEPLNAEQSAKMEAWI